MPPTFNSNTSNPFYNKAVTDFLAMLQSSPTASPYAGYQDLSGYSFAPNPNASKSGPAFISQLNPQYQGSDASIKQIQNDVNRYNNELTRELGVKKSDLHSKVKHNSLLSRALDIISRPMYATADTFANAVDNMAKSDNEHRSSGLGRIGQALESLGKGALTGIPEGITGKKKNDFIYDIQHYADVHHAQNSGDQAELAKIQADPTFHPGHVNKAALIGGGLASDILFDPTTYAGVGLAKDMADVAKASKTAHDLLNTLHNANKISDADRELLTGARYAKGQQTLDSLAGQSAQAEVAARRVATDHINQEIKNLQDSFNSTHGKSLPKQQRGQSIQEVARLRNVWRNEKATLDSNIKALRTTGRDSLVNDILESHNAVKEAPVYDKIAIGAAGKLGKKFTLPGTAPVGKGVKATRNAIGDFKFPNGKSMRDLFVPGAGVDQELKDIAQGAHAGAITHGHDLGILLRRTFNKLTPQERNKAFKAAQGSVLSGYTVPVGGKELDAADALRLHFGRIQQGIEDYLKNGGNIQEVNQHLPKGMGLPTGTTVSGDWLIKHVGSKLSEDPVHQIWILDHALRSAVNHRDTLNMIAKRWGINIADTLASKKAGAKEVLKNAQNAGYKELGLPGTEGYLVAPHVHDAITTLEKHYLSPDPMNKLASKIQGMTWPIKFLLTLPNPSHHIRNSIGDMFVNAMDHVSPKAYRRSAAVMKTTPEYIDSIGHGLGDVPYGMAPEPIKAAESAGTHNLIPNKQHLKDSNGGVPAYLTGDLLHTYYKQLGLGQNFAARIRDYIDTGTKSDAFKNKTLGKIQDLSQTREDYFRLAHFLELMERNPSHAKTIQGAAEFAARRIRETHFDYSDLTPFERNTMRSVIPFYTWTRKNLPLAMQMYFHNPGIAIAPSKFARAIAVMSGQQPENTDVLPQLDKVVPQWMIQGGFTPFLGSNSNSPTLNYLPSPFNDALTQSVPGANENNGAVSFNQLLGMANPLATVPLQVASNDNYFLGDKIHSPTSKHSNAYDKMMFLLSQTPITNSAKNAAQGNTNTLINLLTGLYSQADNGQRQKGELLRQRDIAKQQFENKKREAQAARAKKG